MDKIKQYLDEVLNNPIPLDYIDYEKIQSIFTQLKRNHYSEKSSFGLDLIKYYHPSILRCNIKNHKSLADAWKDPLLMYRVIDNRLRYLKEDLTLKDIRNGMYISKIVPRVSLFKPVLAKYIVEKYLNEFDTIFDPCSGFSGRLLGTCACGKKYIGQDINSVTVSESDNLIRDLNLNAEVSCKDSIYTKGEYGCLFTCPPYGDKENWHQEIEVLSCDEWIDVCLKNYKCKRYVFVIDKTEKYKDHIVEEIKHKSHLSSSKEYIVVVDR